jgi:hypothetical protein
MPQPNAYAQYGFGGAGYGGFPNGQSSVPGVGAGMPQPNPAQAGAGMALGGQGIGDNSMAGQGNTAPGQWGASDPSAFYQQQYWGGKLTVLSFSCNSILTCQLQVIITSRLSQDLTAKTELSTRSQASVAGCRAE